MKKVILLFTILTLLSAAGGLQTTFAQVTQEWVAIYNSDGSQDDWLKSMVIDAHGNVYVTGYIQTTGPENANMCTIKYNNTGVQQWVTIYNGPGTNSNDVGRAIAVDRFGNVYITGESERAGLLSDDYCTIKYSSNGVQQWVARYTGLNGTNDPYAIGVDYNGNVYVTGTSTANYGKDEAATVKYDNNGVQQWVNRFSDFPAVDAYVQSIAVDSAGNSFISCSTNHIVTIKYNSSGVQQWLTVTPTYNITSTVSKIIFDKLGNIYITGNEYETSAARQVLVTCKYNSSGVQQWVSTNAGPINSSGIARSLAVDQLGNVYITGYTSPNNGSQGADYTTIKYNSSGVQQWLIKYNGPANNRDEAYDLVLDDSAYVYVSGISLDSSSNYEIAIIKYSSSGNQQWVVRYSGSGTFIKIDSLKNMYIAGTISNNTTGVDYQTMKLVQLNGIAPISNKIPAIYQLSQNYPNPFNPSTKIKFDIPDFPLMKGARGMSVRLTVYDLLGREITTLVNQPLQPGMYEVEWDASNYPSGVYFYRFTAGDFLETKKLVLIK